MLTVIRPWYEAKLFIEHATRIDHGTLHVVVGFLAWLAVALIWRQTLASWRPWLAVLVLILWNELVDLAIEQWPHPGMQVGEGVADLLLTMLVPTMIMLAVRHRPDLFMPPSAPDTIDDAVDTSGGPTTDS